MNDNFTNGYFDYGESKYRANDITLRRMELLFKLNERARERNIISEAEYDSALESMLEHVAKAKIWI